MSYWELFWTGALIVAASSFAVITVIVTFRGYRDLMQMFQRLTQQGKENE